MKTAVLLGAGASKAFGYPLTNAILPRILERAAAGKLFARKDGSDEKQTRPQRTWFIQRLEAFFPGMKDQIASGSEPGVGVTDLLTLVDRALAHGEARAGMACEDVSRFRQLLERAIYEAIMRDTDRQKMAEQTSLKRFSTWLRALPRPASIVTTNYDMAVDLKIIDEVCAGRHVRHRNRLVGDAVDFGFAWRRSDTGALVPRPARPAWRVYKLHGSVNWLHCPLCGQITVSTRGARGAKAFASDADEWNTCRCDRLTRLRLHLVTPSLIRTYQDPHLLGIWQASIETLRMAERWVIVGYSLPAEDVAIRSLLLRAWDGHALAKKPRVTVVQRPNETTEKIYRSFFPKASLDYQTDGVDGFLAKELG